jgi:hypothetical protein
MRARNIGVMYVSYRHLHVEALEHKVDDRQAELINPAPHWHGNVERVDGVEAHHLVHASHIYVVSMGW